MIFIELATPVDITRCPLSAGRADVPAAGLQSESLVVGSPGAAPVPAMAWNTWDAVGLRYWVPGTPGVGASLITRESGGHSGPTGSANSRSGRRDTDRPRLEGVTSPSRVASTQALASPRSITSRDW